MKKRRERVKKMKRIQSDIIRVYQCVQNKNGTVVVRHIIIIIPCSKFHLGEAPSDRLDRQVRCRVI